jgi:hypothetical protein
MTTLDVQTKCSRPESFVKQAVMNRIVYFIQIIGSALAVVIFLTLFYLVLWMIADYQEFTHKPWAMLTGNPLVAKELLAKASKHHGTPGFEVRCQEYTFTRDKDGRVCKAFNNQHRR